MKDLRSFLSSFLEKEAKVETALGIPSLESLYSTIDNLNNYLTEGLKNVYVHRPSKLPGSQTYYDNNLDSSPVNARRVYKISKYSHPDFPVLYIFSLCLYNDTSICFIFVICFVPIIYVRHNKGMFLMNLSG